MPTYLMKSEPSEYSIADLEKDGTTLWYGVRNYQARNFMRDMQAGDRVLFYHSTCPEPGIYGLARIVAPTQTLLDDFCTKHHVAQKFDCIGEKILPDPTQFDPKSKYFDSKSLLEKPRWYAAAVEFQEVLTKPILLSDLRDIPDLASLRVLQTGNRLSITPVTDLEYNRIRNSFPFCLMVKYFPASSRGQSDIDWLSARFTYSFAGYYNPSRMGFGALRVINDDVIAAHSGFGMHGHENMEIITIVLEGELTHTDSMGNMGVIRAGDVQLMSAGTGVRHSEINAGDIPVKIFANMDTSSYTGSSAEICPELIHAFDWSLD